VTGVRAGSDVQGRAGREGGRFQVQHRLVDFLNLGERACDY
jgi:hypothetical protein